MPDGSNDALPDLDYAFLAEYARLEQGGTLTALGASFTQIAVPRLPSALQFAVAGRVRMRADSPGSRLTARMLPAGEDAPQLQLDIDLSTTGATPYAGRVGVLFAVNTTLPALAEGECRVELDLDGTRVRTLLFTIRVAPGA